MPTPGPPGPAETTPTTTQPAHLPGRPEETTTTQPNPRPTAPPTKSRPIECRQPPPGRRLVRRLPVALALAAALLVVFATPAFAQGSGGGTPSLSGVIDNLRNWIVGILAGVATLFLTIGGLRYLTAGGDPGQVEKAKTALKSAAVGYALAVLAPLIVSILASLVHG